MTETASKINAKSLTDEISRYSSQSSFISSEPELSESFRTINNRKYGNSTNYMLPVDDEGINRLDLQHFICRQLCHGNFNAPIDDALESGIRVLDVGCGSGCWTIDMAQDFKNSIFVGIDAAPVFPTDKTHSIPANTSFIKADVLRGLPFEDGAFDYVFCRFMVAAFSPVNWQVAVEEMKRVLKPGGCLELFEMSMEMMRASKNCMKAEGPFRSICIAKGIDLEYVQTLGKLLLDNGFENIEEDYISVPIGWGGRVGELQAENARLINLAIAPLVIPIMNVDDEQYQKIVDNLIEHYRVRKVWHKALYYFGWKP